MSQYTRVINLDKKQSFSPLITGDYSTQAEWASSWYGTGLALSMLTLDPGDVVGKDNVKELDLSDVKIGPVLGAWRGDRIVVAGDLSTADRKGEGGTSDGKILFESDDFECIGERLFECMASIPYIRGRLFFKQPTLFLDFPFDGKIFAKENDVITEGKVYVPPIRYLLSSSLKEYVDMHRLIRDENQYICMGSPVYSFVWALMCMNSSNGYGGDIEVSGSKSGGWAGEVVYPSAQLDEEANDITSDVLEMFRLFFASEPEGVLKMSNYSVGVGRGLVVEASSC